MSYKTLSIPLAVLLIILFAAIYIVDETEQVVITQFGKPVGVPKVDPGLYFRIPLIQQANYFPKNLLEWDGDPGQIPTLDKTFIYVDTFARCNIVDPLKFFQTVSNELGALARLDDIIDSAEDSVISVGSFHGSITSQVWPIAPIFAVGIFAVLFIILRNISIAIPPNGLKCTGPGVLDAYIAGPALSGMNFFAIFIINDRMNARHTRTCTARLHRRYSR